MLILAAGLGTGLAVPAVLQSLDKKPDFETSSNLSLISAKLAERQPAPPPILAVLDPSSLVGKSAPNPVQVSATKPTPVPSTPVPVIQPVSTTQEPEIKRADEPIDSAETEAPPLTTAQLKPILEPLAVEEPDLIADRQTTILVKPGDTLLGILVDAGSSRQDASNAIAAVKPHFDIRRLRAGQNVQITSSPADDGLRQISKILIETAVDRQVQVTRSDEGVYNGEELITELQMSERFTGGEITSSLYLAADRDNIPANTIVSLIRVFSYGVDFQREIHPGDSYQVLYETYSDDAGKELKQGNLLYAMLSLGSRNMALYRFKTADGFIDYYDKNGRSIKRLLMRTPIDGARLSSRFGKRRHPILGYTKLHTGTDFAAPRGTPIMAAGNGVLKFVGRKGGYGKYISIRHNDTFSTAYAHMSRYAKGMKKGKRVSQGQVIGYVGTTGRSTGNHLHYEVRKNGKPVNPMGLRLPVGRELSGKELKAFRQQIDQVHAMMRRESPPLISKGPSDNNSSGSSSISFSSLPFPGRLR